MSTHTALLTARRVYEGWRGSDLRIVDVRFRLADPGEGKRLYLTGHLPGATYLHLEEDLSGPVRPDTGRHPLPAPDRLARRLARCGIDNGSRVVVYDDAGGAMAARLWWLLRWLGHDEVALMDGGLRAWVDAGYPLAAGEECSPIGGFEPSIQTDMVVETEEIELSDRADLMLVDVRESERFMGIAEPIDRVAGRIPGAINDHYLNNLGPGCRFLDVRVLRRRWLSLLDGHPPQSVALMCGSGVTACQGLLAMELAGLRGARLYAGSWSEWIADPARPVMTGPDDTPSG